MGSRIWKLSGIERKLVLGPLSAMVAALLLVMPLAGCGDDEEEQPDAALDNGVDARIDAVLDAPVPDAPVPDVAVPDAPPPPDAAVLGACSPTFAGCAAFDNLIADTTVEINFGGTLGSVYAPECILVSAGTTVTFIGDFTVEPIEQACGPTLVITNPANGQTQASFVFNAAGAYGYYSTTNGTSAGTGMTGLIVVVP